MISPSLSFFTNDIIIHNILRFLGVSFTYDDHHRHPLGWDAKLRLLGGRDRNWACATHHFRRPSSLSLSLDCRERVDDADETTRLGLGASIDGEERRLRRRDAQASLPPPRIRALVFGVALRGTNRAGWTRFEAGENGQMLIIDLCERRILSH